MLSRREAFSEFVRQFADDLPARTTLEELARYEERFACVLPTAFKEFLTAHGSINTSVLLDRIVDRELNHPDLMSIDPPSEAMESTEAYWSAGMPSNVARFGSDCMGNMFGFDLTALRQGPHDDLPVLFFDHDFNTVEPVAASFEQLIRWYIEHAS